MPIEPGLSTSKPDAGPSSQDAALPGREAAVNSGESAVPGAAGARSALGQAPRTFSADPGSASISGSRTEFSRSLSEGTRLTGSLDRSPSAASAGRDTASRDASSGASTSSRGAEASGRAASEGGGSSGGSEARSAASVAAHSPSSSSVVAAQSSASTAHSSVSSSSASTSAGQASSAQASSAQAGPQGGGAGFGSGSEQRSSQPEAKLPSAEPQRNSQREAATVSPTTPTAQISPAAATETLALRELSQPIAAQQPGSKPDPVRNETLPRIEAPQRAENKQDLRSDIRTETRSLPRLESDPPRAEPIRPVEPKKSELLRQETRTQSDNMGSRREDPVAQIQAAARSHIEERKSHEPRAVPHEALHKDQARQEARPDGRAIAAPSQQASPHSRAPSVSARSVIASGARTLGNAPAAKMASQRSEAKRIVITSGREQARDLKPGEKPKLGAASISRKDAAIDSNKRISQSPRGGKEAATARAPAAKADTKPEAKQTVAGQTGREKLTQPKVQPDPKDKAGPKSTEKKAAAKEVGQEKSQEKAKLAQSKPETRKEAARQIGKDPVTKDSRSAAQQKQTLKPGERGRTEKTAPDRKSGVRVLEKLFGGEPITFAVVAREMVRFVKHLLRIPDNADPIELEKLQQQQASMAGRGKPAKAGVEAEVNSLGQDEEQPMETESDEAIEQRLDLQYSIESERHETREALKVYSIRGRVVEFASAQPIAGVTLYLSGFGSVTTNLGGEYVFENVPHGTPYSLIIDQSTHEFTPPEARGVIIGYTHHHFFGKLRAN